MIQLTYFWETLAEQQANVFNRDQYNALAGWRILAATYVYCWPSAKMMTG